MEFQIAGLKCVNNSDEHQLEFELASEMFDLHVRLDRLTKKGNMGICGVFVALEEKDDVLTGTIGSTRVLYLAHGSDGYCNINGIASVRYHVSPEGGHYIVGTLMGQTIELACHVGQEEGFIHVKQKTSFFNWKGGTMAIEDVDVREHETVRSARGVKLPEFQPQPSASA